MDDTESNWRSDEYHAVYDLNRFKWMRTLDFNAIDVRRNDNFPQGINDLVYLRYLGFRDCYLDELPLSCSKFPFLETLDLRVRRSSRGRKMIIPNVIRKLSRLRHLYFPIAYQTIDKKKLKLNGLEQLEILENFHPGVCYIYDLEKMTKLCIFTVIADGTCVPDLHKLVTVTAYRKHLCMSSLTLASFNCCSDHRVDLLTNLVSRHSLQVLHLEGQMEQMARVFPNLTKIVFDGCEFKQDPMTELGRLEHLQSLVLCNDAIDVFLERWLVGDGAMTELSILTLEKCPKLQAVPHELIAVSALKKLEMGSMPRHFQENVFDILRCYSDRRSKGKANEPPIDRKLKGKAYDSDAKA